MQQIRTHSIVADTFVDGPGRRAALFVQGCSIHCPGCQNQALWSPNAGNLYRPDVVARMLISYNLPITITGGEPMDQAGGVGNMLNWIRTLDSAAGLPRRHVIMYTGYRIEELLATGNAGIMLALGRIDVLVDGPYIQSQDWAGMQYRGSRNQRVIDMPATMRRPLRDVMRKGPMMLDWDSPEVIVDSGGNILATVDVLSILGFSQGEESRRCGETGGGK